MKQHKNLTPFEQLLTIRDQLAQAYEQNDAPLTRELSREIDEIQLAHWRQCAAIGA